MSSCTRDAAWLMCVRPIAAAGEVTRLRRISRSGEDVLYELGARPEPSTT